MKKDNRKRFIYFIIMQVLLLLLLTGCWSSKPIEDLNIIVGSAVDKDKGRKIRSTLQYVVPQVLSSKKDGGASQGKPYLNVSEKGPSPEPIGWKTTLKKEGYIFGAHQKIIVIGAELAREVNLEELLDLYYRDVDIRGSTLVFISKGKASTTLETQEPNIIPSLKIAEIAGEHLTMKLLKPVTLTNILGKMDGGASFLLQQIDAKKGKVKFEGAAVINGKSKKMIGSFNEDELEGINWITAENQTGSIKAYDEQKEQPIYYEVESIKSHIKPIVNGEQISFKVDIESEGRISEYWDPYEKPVYKNKNIKKIERVAGQNVKHLMEKVVAKMQKEYKADVVGFGNQLRIKNPKVWDKVKDDWDQKFSKIPVQFTVNLNIKDYGMVRKKNTEK